MAETKINKEAEQEGTENEAGQQGSGGDEKSLSKEANVEEG